MADKIQLAILKRSISDWNKWRQDNPYVPIDLSDADLTGADLEIANLGNADLHGATMVDAVMNGANLSYADLKDADLCGADLHEAYLIDLDLSSTKLTGAVLNETNLSYKSFRDHDLRNTNFEGAYLTGTDFSDAKLSGSNFKRASLIRTIFTRADISNCNIFGISAWNVNLEGATQLNLIITDYNEPIITVDNLEVAQFIYLLIHNEKLRSVIDTITSKAVLILGRFTPERIAVLQAIREELRQRNYVPILFDFEGPENRDTTETVSTLAHMACFVIADLTDPRSVPHELMSFVPDLQSLPVQPLILKGQDPYSMFGNVLRRSSVLPIHEYEDQAQLIAELVDKVIAPAEAKVIELRPRNP